jgi:S1-C subfamily serine protease
MRVLCPHCNVALKIDGATPGGLLTCPKCKNPFSIPESDEKSSDEGGNSFDFNKPSQKSDSPRKKPVRKRDDRDDDDDDDRGSRRSRTGAKKSKGNSRLVVSLVGVIVVLLVGGGVALSLLTRGQKESPIVQKDPDKTPNPNQPNPTQPNPPKPNGDANRNMPPAEVAELFKGDVALPTPSRSVASLRLPPGTIPTGLSLNLPPNPNEKKPNPADGKLTLDEIKKATVYIKVSAGPNSGTGSGFLIRKDGASGGLVATNHHVIRGALGPIEGGSKGKVTVVFDSGIPTEASYTAEIIAFDPQVDLAILRLKDVENLPKPIDPRLALAPTETQSILTCGFPLGETLATGGRNPAITIGKGAVSSLRRNETGKIALVQLDAALNPGNSGGPIVDPDGRLIGIAVATIRGSVGIGLAIPAAELNAVLDGYVLYPIFLPMDSGEQEAAFSSIMPVIDPLNRIQAVSFHVWSGEGKAPAVPKDPMSGFLPTPGAKKYDVSAAVKGLAACEIRIPSRGAAQTVLVQTAIARTSGPPIVSEAVAYRLKVTDVQMATDTVAISGFAKNTSRYHGQTIALRGTMDMSHGKVWNMDEVVVHTETGGFPTGALLFLADQKVINEFPDARYLQAVPVRLTVRVGKPLPDNRTPVRIARIDLIGRGDRIVSSLPAAEGADEDLLTTLNRDPARFVGQSVVVDSELLPSLPGGAAALQMLLTLPSGQLPQNLIFLPATPDLAAAIRELNVKTSVAVRVTGRVERQKIGPASVVMVTRVELLTEDGQVYKVVR